MSTTTFKTKTLADLDAVIPGFSKVWKQIKAECGTKKRCPSSLTITDRAASMALNDSSLGQRFALDLQTMKLSGGLHVSGGEWAIHSGDNHDKPVDGVPNAAAVISCEWNDFYGFFSIDIQVADGAIAKQLPKEIA